MPLKQILKTLYAPHKAFKEIIQNPKYVGPLLILVMLVVANVAFIYVAASKTYVERSVPTGEKLDEWTENSTLWVVLPNTAITESSDCINGSFYGNRSIAFAVTDATQVWTELDNIGPVNCSSPDEYTQLSFRAKWTSPETKPINMTIKLFSNSSSNYYSYNPTMDSLNLTQGVWNNLTIPIGTEAWTPSNISSDLRNITGLGLELTWNANANITLLVDGLFFHGPFNSFFENAGNIYMINYALLAFMQFVVTWVLLSGLTYIVSKAFGGKLVWKPLLVLIGFALITMFVQVVVNTVAYVSMPNVHYPFDLLVGVQGEGKAAADVVNSQTWMVAYVQRFMQIAVWIWTIALTALAVRFLAAISWLKCAAVGAMAYFVALLAESFIIG